MFWTVALPYFPFLDEISCLLFLLQKTHHNLLLSSLANISLGLCSSPGAGGGREAMEACARCADREGPSNV